MQSVSNTAGKPWKVSLHGGHSGEFCDHAEGQLRELLQAAVEAGYRTFGVSEHAPRSAERFLYPNERALGWDVAKTEADFTRYMEAITPLAEEFADRLIVLRGFEAEVVPMADYAARMRSFRSQTLPDGSPLFDYFVGSVHYVDEIQTDGEMDEYRRGIATFGGMEGYAIRYYETVAAMIEALRPDVVGHLDVIKKNVVKAGHFVSSLDAPAVRAAALQALEAARAYGCILDLNTAGWRKGLGEPYPAPWLVQQAQAMGVGFCFGDDSHRPSEVGAGIEAARDYLLSLDVSSVTVLTREAGEVIKRVVSLLL